MKSLLISALSGMAVAHSGAFLTVWELPYVEEHLTYRDVGRKLNKVFKLDERFDALRDHRDAMRRKNEEIFAARPTMPNVAARRLSCNTTASRITTSAPR